LINKRLLTYLLDIFSQNVRHWRILVKGCTCQISRSVGQRSRSQYKG